VSATPRDLAENRRVDQILYDAEQCLKKSRQLRERAALKVSGKTTTGRINPTKGSMKYLRKSMRVSKSAAVKKQKDCSKTEGKQRESAYVVLGLPMGKRIIGSRIANDKLS